MSEAVEAVGGAGGTPLVFANQGGAFGGPGACGAVGQARHAMTMKAQPLLARVAYVAGNRRVKITTEGLARVAFRVQQAGPRGGAHRFADPQLLKTTPQSKSHTPGGRGRAVPSDP